MDARHELLGQVKRMAKAKGISQADIARTIGLKPSNVSRMLEGKHSCTIDTLMKVVDAIGAKVTLTDK